VRDRDIEIDVPVESSAPLRGTAVSQSESGTVLPVAGVRIILSSNRWPDLRVSMESTADGSFSFPNAPASTYRIQSVIGNPEGKCLSEIRQKDRNALRDGVDANRSAAPIQIVFSESKGSVHGAIVGNDGARIAGATVVLIPDMPLSTESFVAGNTNQNGEFELSCVRPGNFHLYAWRQLEGTAYRNAAFMKRFESKGTSVRVESGGSVAVNAAALD